MSMVTTSSWVDRLRQFAHVDPYGDIFREKPFERIRKVLNPRYMTRKVLLTLYERSHPNHPWITQEATAAFDVLLRPYHRGLEWGSGGGTVWIAQRCRSLVSVEHHHGWFEKVSTNLHTLGLSNVDYRLVDEGRYLDVTNAFPDGFFDFVVVDGLFRDGAFLRSIPKLRDEGFIVFDNVNWYLPSNSDTPHSCSYADGPANEGFGKVADIVRSWKTVWTTNGVNDTAIFIKPHHDGAAAPPG